MPVWRLLNGLNAPRDQRFVTIELKRSMRAWRLTKQVFRWPKIPIRSERNDQNIGREGTVLVRPDRARIERACERAAMASAARLWWRIAKDSNCVGDQSMRDDALMRVREIAMVAREP